MKMEFKKIEKSNNSVGAFAKCLMQMAVILHQKHLQVTGEGSYASHKALNEIYDALPDFADSLIEEYQGYYQKIVDNYPSMDEAKFNTMSPKDTVKWLLDYVEANRTVFGDNSMLQNKVDELIGSISSTLYKLTFLK